MDAAAEEVIVEDPLLAATWAKYIVIMRHVADMSTRDTRAAFQAMRTAPACSPDTFLPRLGVTVGEFCVFHTLRQGSGRRGRAA